MALSTNDKFASCIIQNKELGEIVLFQGQHHIDTNSGYGYKHIVYNRFVKDKLPTNEIAGLIVRQLEILKSAKKEDISYAKKGDKALVEENGVRVVLCQKEFFDTKLWVITSYPVFKKGTKEIEKEVKAYIGSVNDTDEYAKYYSYFRSIVGALTSIYSIEIKEEKGKGEFEKGVER